MSGTSILAKVDRVVDGDTIRVFLNDGDEKSESIRILALDTEEVCATGKPVTPMGRRASEYAKTLIASGDEVKLVLPGNESREIALQKYRGNYGRLLCYVELSDGRDFQEIMIEAGYSPYFQKYGFAHFADRHARYVTAERKAQSLNLGIWDQLQNNGAVMRNYAALCTWWELRGRIIEGYREIKRSMPEANLYNTRLDYEKLLAIAKAGQETTVFMELRSFTRVGGEHVIFNTGSLKQPYQLFIPNALSGAGQEIMHLLLNRYVATSEDEPRRSYAYVTGSTKMYPDETGRPEIIVTRPEQIGDWPEHPVRRGLLV